VGGQSIDAGAAPIAYTARLDANGMLDAAYGFGGAYRYPGGPGGSVLRSMDVVGNGRLLLGVARLETGGVSETLLRVLAATGRLDAGFGRNGRVVVFYRPADTVVDGALRTITAGTRSGSSTSILVQRRYP